MRALLLRRGYLAAGQGSGFEDALEAKLRFVVALLGSRLYFLCSSNSPIVLFWLTHFNLILAPIV